jgi:DNA-binding XRE family transcriptional regulator
MFTKIIQEIIKSGLTESEIADLLSTSQPTINRIRNGKQEPKGELAMAIVELRRKRNRAFNKVA